MVIFLGFSVVILSFQHDYISTLRRRLRRHRSIARRAWYLHRTSSGGVASYPTSVGASCAPTSSLSRPCVSSSHQRRDGARRAVVLSLVQEGQQSLAHQLWFLRLPLARLRTRTGHAQITKETKTAFSSSLMELFCGLERGRRLMDFFNASTYAAFTSAAQSQIASSATAQAGQEAQAFSPSASEPEWKSQVEPIESTASAGPSSAVSTEAQLLRDL